MSKLGEVVGAVEKYERFVLDQVKRARANPTFGTEMLRRWNEIRANTPITRAPTGLELPRLALPEFDEPGEIARYLFGEGLPGEFPFRNGAYRELYLEPLPNGTEAKDGRNDVVAGISSAKSSKKRRTRPLLHRSEEPTRLFVALGLGEDTNARFRCVTGHQRTARLSTGFDGPTLYGLDSDADGVFGKIGEGGVAIDMIEFSTREMPRWYPVSISGYHMGEAGATPVQQAAYTLSNGFAYAELLSKRGTPVDQFAPRFSFFLDCGLDVEYVALARVARKIWAIGMRDVFGAGSKGQMFKLHTQTSGRSLVAAEFKNNLTRTAAEMMLAFMNGTNSCHSNSADEPFTTPSEEWMRLAAHGQAILLEESGIFKHTMNMLSGSPGMKAVERAVEAATLEEFCEIERLGGVLAAVEDRYQRSQIQSAAHCYEQQIYEGTRPIIGLNRYRNGSDDIPEVKLARTPRKKQQLQVDRLAKFKKKNAEKAKRALDKLAAVVESGKNCFPELLEAVEVCSLGQITGRLQEVVGRFRPMV